MTRWSTMLTIAAVLIFAGLNPPAVTAGTGSGHGGGPTGHAMPNPGAAPQGKAVEVELLDLALVDQDGQKVRFKSEVIGNRLVIIDTFYTTCDTICPILSALFVNLQHKLGTRLGQDVVLVSISVDPGTDIPARIKKYAASRGAGPGWIFLTGGKRSVERVLRGIGAYVRDYTQHAPSILVGDGRHGGWTRFYEFPSPDLILERLEELRAARLVKAQ
ncbi:MAG: SCO family protein [Planctomycetales bacterium]|nr:SCO family protein [Planctomycetales bacterium]